MKAVIQQHWTATVLAITGLLTLGTSLLPWYRTRWLRSDDGIDSWLTSSANAWAASTRWTLALLLATSGVAMWVFAAIGGSRRPAQLRLVSIIQWISTILVAIAAVIAIWEWLSIPGATISGAGWSTAAQDSGPIGAIQRDRLTILHIDGHDRDIAWGMYAGLGLMTILTAGMAVATACERNRRWRSRGGSGAAA